MKMKMKMINFEKIKQQLDTKIYPNVNTVKSLPKPKSIRKNIIYLNNKIITN